jgi:hypothetical protein
MKAPSRFHASLDLASLESNLAAREALINAILKLAPQSPLYANTPMQQAVATLGSTFTTFKSAGTTSAASAKQHKLDVAAEVAAKADNDRALLLVKSLAENGAKSADDIASMAFTPLHPGRTPNVALLPPDSIDITMGKKGHGKVKVAAHETGSTRHRYAAEMSPDPIAANTWTVIPGTGKSRRLTGKSGTSVWVRFALVHGQQQSDWGTPVLVTFP